MDKVLYTAMSGAKNNMTAQAIHSNNLANVATDGFKADFERARTMPIYYGEGHPTRAFSMTENPGTNFAYGSMNATGRDFDIAVEGDGFIAVLDKSGQEAYTRGGSLSIDQFGTLRTAQGLPVLGDGGPITIPPAEKIDIAIDGTITAAVKGEGVETLAIVARVRLVSPDTRDVAKGEDGLFRARDGEVLPVSTDVKVLSGFLEGSNVSAIHEFTRVLELARQYEMQVKIMKTSESHAQASARLLQMS